MRLYYFSGTGNTLAVARELANQCSGDHQIIRINDKLLGENHNEMPSSIQDNNVVGLLFPVYHQGLPGIIRRFVEWMNFEKSRVLFCGICFWGQTYLSPQIS